MKITIKVAPTGADPEAEGNVHSWTYLDVPIEYVNVMLENVTAYLLFEAASGKPPSKKFNWLVEAANMKIDLCPCPKFNPPETRFRGDADDDGLTKADKEWLKNIGIGGLE